VEEEREFQQRFAMCEYMYSSHVRAVGDHLLTSSKQRTDRLQLKTRTVSAQSVISTRFSAAVHSGVRELEFSSIQSCAVNIP